MKANSNTRPPDFIKSKSAQIFNFNIVEIIRKDFKGVSVKSFNYEYVEIKGEVTRNKLIAAIIANSYSKDDELALLHNRLINKNNVDYEDFQIFRTNIKQIVDLVLLNKH